ncbi:MAG: hypothetical protein L3J74_16385, partial [Bacteroidales bacterium]|nr:hypothetical protein [Bacteroidales bacterium]
MRHIFLFLALLIYTNIFAGSGTINFVETTVELDSRGKATVKYVVQYHVIEGELHGFYFSGNGKLSIKAFADESYAVDDFGNRYNLSITNVGYDKWDIVLADGKGVANGNVTYVFYFKTNFSEAKYLEYTKTDTGDSLVVFHWSPAQFDESYNMDHYTLKLIFPVQAATDVENLRNYYMGKNIIRTEKWVNEKYLIDYQKTKTGKLQMIFHKTKPGNRYQMLVQIYLPPAWFNLNALSLKSGQNQDKIKDDAYWDEFYAKKAAKKAEKDKSNWWIWILAILTGFYFIVTYKHKSMSKAIRQKDEIDWGKLDWTPPQLTLSHYHIEGKICMDLNPLEAAFYLEIPFKSILSGMIKSLEMRGIISIRRKSPLFAEVKGSPEQFGLDEYETQLYNSLADDGEFSQEELSDLLNLIVKNIQKKAWDCDVEETKKYYRKLMNEWMQKHIPQERQEVFRNQRQNHLWWYWYNMRNRNWNYKDDEDEYWEFNPHELEYDIPVNIDH